ncbi:MAG: cysteine desulfurase family protein [bacterium]|nr:cysteine desulfurase family protein [bacterium]
MPYLDHAASSPLRPSARAAWLEAAAVVGNPSATHASGREARRLLEDARESIATSLGADPAEVLLTSGGTEADNLAVLGAVRASRPLSSIPDDDATVPALVTSAIEHPAVLEAARLLEGEGFGVAYAPARPSGQVDALALGDAVGEGTALVSLMWANNETGVIQPVSAAVTAAGEAGAIAHSDAVQAIGHLPFHFHESDLDLASISGHKVGAPVGTGALLARRGVALRAIGAGGGQERGIRSGTVDVAGAAALAAALAEAVAVREEEAARLRLLRGRIEEALAATPGARITGAELAENQRLPHLTHAVIEGLRAEALLFALDRAGLSASAGSACRAGVHQPSHVVLAMGGSEEEAGATLRCSLGWTTTEADVEALIGALPTAIERARAAGTRR